MPQSQENFIVEREPRLFSTTHFKYLVKPDVRSVHDYFKKQEASTWCLQNYVRYILENLENENIDFDQALSLFTESLDQVNQIINIPLPIKSFCKNYLVWLKSCAGIATTGACRNFFDAKKVRSQSLDLHDTIETTICLNAKTEVFQSHLQSSGSLPPPKTSPQIHRYLTHLISTPNKRPLENQEFRHYSQDISVICAFGMTTAELTGEIGEELVRKLSSVRDKNPSVWTPALEQYIDTTLKKTGNDFRRAVLDHVPNTENELFKSYCEKLLLDFFHLFDVHSTISRNIGERKYIINLVAPLFKFYEATFTHLYFDWIESNARAAKMIKSSTFSGIVRVDAKATRHSDGLDVWHMEVAGPSDNASDDHIINDAKKALRTDILNLVAILRNHLDCDVDIATKIKVFCTQAVKTRLTLYALNMLSDGRFLATELTSAVIPFSFNGRSQYKSILRMMAIFHEEIEKQEMLMEEINCCVLRSKKITVRQVLKIPDLE